MADILLAFCLPEMLRVFFGTAGSQRMFSMSRSGGGRKTS